MVSGKNGCNRASDAPPRFTIAHGRRSITI
jgi:hypothetical protein